MIYALEEIYDITYNKMPNQMYTDSIIVLPVSSDAAVWVATVVVADTAENFNLKPLYPTVASETNKTKTLVPLLVYVAVFPSGYLVQASTVKVCSQT